MNGLKSDEKTRKNIIVPSFPYPEESREEKVKIIADKQIILKNKINNEFRSVSNEKKMRYKIILKNLKNNSQGHKMSVKKITKISFLKEKYKFYLRKHGTTTGDIKINKTHRKYTKGNLKPLIAISKNIKFKNCEKIKSKACKIKNKTAHDKEIKFYTQIIKIIIKKNQLKRKIYESNFNKNFTEYKKTVNYIVKLYSQLG